MNPAVKPQPKEKMMESSAASPKRGRSRVNTVELARRFGIFAVLAVVVIGAQVAYSGFLEWDNIKLVLAQNAPLGIVAIAMTLVIISGGFDLSVGAVFATAGTLAAIISQHHGVWLGISVGLLAGLAAGAFNAFVITRLRVNPFVATLGSASLFSGVILLISHSNPYPIRKSSFLWFGQGKIFDTGVPVFFLIALTVVGWVLLHRSSYGRRLLAVGGSAEASRLAGIRADLVQASAYVITGLLAAFAGIISAAQLGVGQGTAGGSLPLESIAVVVVGGTSLLGGEGSILRTIAGLLILASLDNIFFSLAVDNNWQLITQGAIVIAAVAFDQYFRRLQSK
jgi:ribose transport system permease protein